MNTQRNRHAFGRSIGILTAAFAMAALATTWIACKDGRSSGTTAADSLREAHARDSALIAPPPKLAQAPADIASDTIPLTAPDGEPARYGLRSGRIVQRFTGNQRGERITTFDDYGMRERREESMAPFPEGHKGSLHNVITIVTPEEQSFADMRSKKGAKRPNENLARYMGMGASKTISLGELALQKSGGTRLADTVISGYHCRVYRKEFNGMMVTNWVWRGITLGEHVYSPLDTVEYSVVPIEITANIDVPAGTFAFGPDYTIQPYRPPTQPQNGVEPRKP